MSSQSQSQFLEKLRLASATQQARVIAQGEVTSSMLMAAEAAAVEQHNPQLNAFVVQAQRSAPPATTTPSPLFGTSFAVKDNFDVSGTPTQCGLRVMDTTPAQYDATVVARLRQAGMVYSGKLNMSPMALGSSTHNSDFGHCYNPLRTGFSAGGSSGGSASAVAAGLVGITLGTDTMGSVRLPAAFCGIVGFKPGWGRLPADGVVPLSRMLDHVGVLSRSVEDAIHAYTLLRGESTQTAITATQPLNCSSMRVGIVSDTTALELDEDVTAAYVRACQQLRSAGYTLIPVDASNLHLSAVRRSGLVICEAELLHTLAGIYPECREGIPLELLSMLDYISGQPAESVGRALSRLALAKERYAALFDEIAVLALPTCGHTAFSMDDPVPVNSADLTVIANVLGAPAISLPLPPEHGGLPAALQLIGYDQQDVDLLRLAAEIETVIGATF